MDRETFEYVPVPAEVVAIVPVVAPNPEAVAPVVVLPVAVLPVAVAPCAGSVAVNAPLAGVDWGVPIALSTGITALSSAAAFCDTPAAFDGTAEASAISFKGRMATQMPEWMEPFRANRSEIPCLHKK